jgi:hypothetical protein
MRATCTRWRSRASRYLRWHGRSEVRRAPRLWLTIRSRPWRAVALVLPPSQVLTLAWASVPLIQTIRSRNSAIDQGSPGRHAEGYAVSERDLPSQDCREVALEQDVALVYRRQDCADNQRRIEGSSEHRTVAKRASGAFRLSTQDESALTGTATAAHGPPSRSRREIRGQTHAGPLRRIAVTIHACSGAPRRPELVA